MKRSSIFILLLLLSADVLSQNSNKHLIIDGIKAKVRASSELSSRRSPDAYSVLNAFDNDTSTAWVEGSKGNGAGEWIEVWFEHPVLIKKIRIVNGYRKSSQLFDQNNRMAAFDIRFDSNKSPLFSNKQIDTAVSLQVNRITSKMRFVVADVAAGTKYNDLCISEILLETENAESTTISGEENLIKEKEWCYRAVKGNIKVMSVTGKRPVYDTTLAGSHLVKDTKIEKVGTGELSGFEVIRVTLQYEHDRDEYYHILNRNGSPALLFHKSSRSTDGSSEYELKVEDDSTIVFTGECSYPECGDFEEAVRYEYRDGIFGRKQDEK